MSEIHLVNSYGLEFLLWIMNVDAKMIGEFSLKGRDNDSRKLRLRVLKQVTVGCLLQAFKICRVCVSAYVRISV